MIIGMTLAIMLILTIFSIVLGNDFISSTIETAVDTDAIINGSTSDFVIEGITTDFSIDPIIGAIAIIIGIIALATIIGIQILATGLSDASIRIVMIATAYIGLWAVLSVLASSLITGIEVFGSLIYITLTITYTIGVVQKLAEGGT